MGLADRQAYQSLYGDLVHVVPFYKNHGWNFLSLVGRDGELEFYVDGKRCLRPPKDFTLSVWVNGLKLS